MATVTLVMSRAVCPVRLRRQLCASALKRCFRVTQQGFRRYLRIRETLCHELAHMVWSEHDNRFKQLNSELMRECQAADWVSQSGAPPPLSNSRPVQMAFHDAAPGCVHSTTHTDTRRVSLCPCFMGVSCHNESQS